jgi:hypothetical protein
VKIIRNFRVISCLAVRLLLPQDRLCSTQIVNKHYEDYKAYVC